MKMGVYAYKNILDGTIFYVGRQSYSVALEQYGYQRAEDFESTNRNVDCLNYIKKIGKENIEIVWLYETKDVSENLFPIELKFQELYYNIYKDNFLCYEHLLEDKNPNFGNKWSEEKRLALSEKRKRNGKSKGKNNPSARKCILFGPNDEEIKFDTISDMRTYFQENIAKGKYPYEPQQNEFKDKNIKRISPDKRDAYKRTIGWYYIKV